jgi:hypothetical protein
MATMSIGKAWEEAIAFIRRESALLLPVALLFIALPSVILQQMTPTEIEGAKTMAEVRALLPRVPSSYWTAMGLTLVLLWFGSMTIFGLVLRGGISVGESLRLALVRMPTLLGATVLMSVAMMVGLILAGALAGVLGGAAPAVGDLVAVLALAASAWIGLRMVLLNTVILDRDVGAIACIRIAWAMGRGNLWRFAALFLVSIAFSLVASMTAQMLFGSIGILLAGKAVGIFIADLAGAVVSTLVLMVLLVMLARLYRQAAG